MNKKLFVISGCSGVGKGTVLKEFMARNSEHFLVSISCTTRKPRPGEVDGVNYFFVTKDEFTRCINENKFLEYAEFAGNFYGTKKKYITQNEYAPFIYSISYIMEMMIFFLTATLISFIIHFQVPLV